MPLLPIDLQTLFSQSNQVAKEQAVQKDAAPLAQSAQGSQLVQKTEQRDNAVNETPTQEEGPEKVKSRTRSEPWQPQGKGQGAARNSRLRPARDVFRDPALGRNVDVTG